MRKVTLWKSILRLAFVLLAILSTISAASAATFTVDSLGDPGTDGCGDGECTLREALTAANANPGADVIDFSVTGTINLTGELPVINDDLALNGPGPNKLTVRRDTGGDYEIFFVTGPAKVSFSGLTISNGRGFNGQSGGGIYNNFANVSISNATISGNSAISGGGIFNQGILNQGTMSITDSTVTGNVAFSLGGAVVNAGTLTITRSTLNDNQTTGPDGAGGAIANFGSMDIFTSTINGNSTSGNGGGVYTESDGNIINSTISGNSANLGGGIYNNYVGSLNIANSTIALNSASLKGAGIWNEAGLINLRSSIVALNSGNADLDGNHSVSSLGYNIVGTFSSIVSAPSDQLGVTATQLKLGPLQDNGGPTMTHALLPGSVALDSGINFDSLTTDQRGLPRPYDDPHIDNPAGGDGTDVGAFEVQAVPFSSDLLIGLGVDKTSVKVGDYLTYTITVRNYGPYDGLNTIVNDFLSSGMTFVSAKANRGTFTAPPVGQTGTVTWNLGRWLRNSEESAQIKVTVILKGKTTVTNSVTVSSDTPDPNMANNSASITTTVAAGNGGNK